MEHWYRPARGAPCKAQRVENKCVAWQLNRNSENVKAPSWTSWRETLVTTTTILEMPSSAMHPVLSSSTESSRTIK